MRIISTFRRFVSTSLFLILVIRAVSQGTQPPAPPPPSVVPPSPNAFAFSKYGNIPVSPYNGLPTISIPIFDISYRDIKVPISISYHASGIKVGEEASRVGLGWVLNAGGVISRSIINGDDLSTDGNSYMSNNAPAIPFGPTSPPTSTIQGAYSYQYYTTAGGSVANINLLDYQSTDFEPDQFTYNFGSYSGKFVLSKAGQPILEKQSKIRIVLSAARDTWEVTTADGVIYKFLQSEYFVDYNNTAGAPQKSAWYLSEIISATGASVKFYYKVQVDQFLAPVGSYYERKGRSVYSCAGMQNCKPSPNAANPISPKKYSNIVLDSIGWNTGRLTFNYDTRDDIDGDKRLISVQILKKKNNLPSEEVVLVQDYFTSNSAGPVSPYEFTTPSLSKAAKRLKLTGIVRRPLPYLATNQEEKHFFEYYEDKPFPPKNSYARDHWGYYNGKVTNTSLLPTYADLNVADPNPQQAIGVMGTEKEPSADHMYLLSLKSIIYPTKGKTTFYYEPHEFEYTPETMSSEQSEPEVYTETTPFIYSSSNRGNVVATTFDLTAEYEDQYHKTVPITFQGAFRTNITTPCSAVTGSLDMWFGIFDAGGSEVGQGHVTPNGVRCNNRNETGCVYCPTDANNPDYPSPVFTYKATINLAPGMYQFRAFIGSSETRIQDISVQYTWTVDATKKPQSQTEPDGSLKKYKIAGGLRIKKIEDWEPDGGRISNVRTYDYRYKTDVNLDLIYESHSYGRRMVKPSYSFYEISWQQVYNNVSSPVECLQCASVVRDSSHPQANYSGSAVGYDKVAEISSSGVVLNVNGSIVYEYENSADQILPSIFPFTPTVPIQPPAVNSISNPGNGNLLRQTYYSSAGVKVRMIENHYNRKYNQIVYGLNQRKIPADAEMSSANPSIHMMLLYPAVSSNFPFQLDTHAVDYSSTGQETNRVTTEFSYDSQEHLQLTRKTNYESNGHKTLTDYKYPADYSVSESSAAVTSMKSKFMHALPLQVTVMDEVSGVRQIKSRDFTLYETLTGGFVLPTQRYTMQNASGKPEGTAGYIPASSFDTTLYKSVYSIAYNASANLSKIQNSLDYPTAYLWGHKESLPIAEVKNAVPAQCFYTSFEEDGDLFTDALGNAAQTGLRVKTASSYTFPASYTPVLANTVMTYWFYQSGQWNFSGVVPFAATITTAGTKIDEVRAYPKWAQMTTFTHIPEVGVSSSTSASNITTNYEYDELGRLKVVRDKDKKIVKTYGYILKK